MSRIRGALYRQNIACSVMSIGAAGDSTGQVVGHCPLLECIGQYRLDIQTPANVPLALFELLSFSFLWCGVEVTVTL